MKTLLVALDGSPIAATVLDEALRIARGSGARLFLFRAVSRPIDLPPEALISPPESVAGILQTQARKELEAIAGSVPPELLAGVLVEVGAPGAAICSAAKQVNADLIVVGAHGHRGIDSLLGTTSTRVVNHADRSVLVVRPTVRS